MFEIITYYNAKVRVIIKYDQNIRNNNEPFLKVRKNSQDMYYCCVNFNYFITLYCASRVDGVKYSLKKLSIQLNTINI